MADIVIPLFISFAVCAALGPFLIPYLHRLKFGNTEREEGVQSHLKKAGTPSMGGVMFLAGILISGLIFLHKYPMIGPVLVLTFGFAAVGFIDDYRKVVKKSSDGLIAWQKLLLEFAVATVFLIIMLKGVKVDLTIRLPFTSGKMADIGFLAIPFFYIVVLAVVNGVNFTDGLDGLASSVTSVVAAFFIASSAAVKAGLGPAAVDHKGPHQVIYHRHAQDHCRFKTAVPRSIHDRVDVPVHIFAQDSAESDQPARLLEQSRHQPAVQGIHPWRAVDLFPESRLKDH